MQSNIYKLFNESDFNINYVKEAYEILISLEQGLDGYVNDFIFDNDLEPCANYSCLDKNIRFNYDKLKNETFNDSYKKLNALLVLRHEIEHAKSLKKVMEGKNDIESIVLRYSFLDYFLENNIDMGINTEGISKEELETRVKDSYDVDPGERIASIRSAKFLVNEFKNTELKDLLLDLRKVLYIDYVGDYNIYGPSTYRFLSNLGLNTEYIKLQTLVNKKDYCLDTRALCGFPMTYPELTLKLRKKCGIIETLY